jgi:hypothetical protein
VVALVAVVAPVLEVDEPAVDDEVAAPVVVEEPVVIEVPAVVEEVVLGEAEARMVWPAISVKPRVASSDAPASQNVATRALRIPRRRLAPLERSEDVGITDR